MALLEGGEEHMRIAYSTSVVEAAGVAQVHIFRLVAVAAGRTDGSCLQVSLGLKVTAAGGHLEQCMTWLSVSGIGLNDGLWPGLDDGPDRGRRHVVGGDGVHVDRSPCWHSVWHNG